MRKKLGRVLAVVLSIGMTLSFVACSDDKDKEKETNTTKTEDGKGEDTSDTGNQSGLQIDKELHRYYVTGNEFDIVLNQDPINAEEILREIEYVPEMFYGEYMINEMYDLEEIGEAAQQEYEENVPYWSSSNIYGDYEYQVAKLPHSINAGPKTINSPITQIDRYEWMIMTYSNADGGFSKVPGTYEIDGNTLLFYPLSVYETDYSNDTVTYEVSDTPIEYEFEFTGSGYALTIDGYSIEYTARALSEYNTIRLVNGYVTSDSEKIDGIDQIYMCSRSGDDVPGEVYLYVEAFTNISDDMMFYYGKDGVATFAYKDENGEIVVHQYLCFNCGNDGLYFTDGENSYKYQASIVDRVHDDFGGNVEEDEADRMQFFSEETLSEIFERRGNLLSDLEDAFTEAGIDVVVDRESGEILLDSSILFANNEYELSNDSKEFLKEFLAVYAEVILHDDYDGFVSRIVVEGHTDSNGSRELNMELSKNRAVSVMEYCKSSETGLDSAITNELAELMQAVGYASDYPIYDENGNEDMDASRRVAFTFIINVDEYDN